jgi:hypothetical protein
MTFEPENGLVLGAVENFDEQFHVTDIKGFSISKLAVELEWSRATNSNSDGVQSAMTTPLVRGAPYTTMKYSHATPRVFVQRWLNKEIIVDGGDVETGSAPKRLVCSSTFGQFSQPAVLVERELKMQFDTSDMTWLLFVSQPTWFVCTTSYVDLSKEYNLPPGVIGPEQPIDKKPFFELRATAPMRKGIVRVALSNNCSTGQNPICKMSRVCFGDK